MWQRGKCYGLRVRYLSIAFGCFCLSPAVFLHSTSFCSLSFLVCRTASLPLCFPSESSEELSPGTRLPLLLLLPPVSPMNGDTVPSQGSESTYIQFFSLLMPSSPPITCAPISGNRRTNHPSAQSAHLCSDTMFSAVQPSSPSGHHRECALTDCRLSWSMLDSVQGE